MARYCVCSEPGCPNVVEGQSRCDECRSAYERARGTKRERGYDAQFDRNRRDPGYLTATQCATCAQPFTDDNPKTAGHVVAVRNGGGSEIKPECRRCNYGWRKTGS